MTGDGLTRKTAIRVPPGSSGSRLLDFVVGRFTYRSREQWRAEIEAGRFSLADGHGVTAATRLVAGDRLVYAMPEIAEPPVVRRCTVIHEDDQLLVVDKPACLPCHPGGRYFRHTLWALLREEHGLPHPCLINRLDRETSGLVLVAKDKRTARLCGQQFAARQVEKRYLVAVEGEFPADTVRAAGRLAHDPTSSVRKKVRFFSGEGTATAADEMCLTTFSLLRRANGLSLLEARPVTGRCHQIRASLLGLGFPVVGDKLYGIDEQLFLRLQQDCLTADDQHRLRLPRQALHAGSLSLLHPADNRPLAFSSPLPEEIAGLFAAATP